MPRNGHQPETYEKLDTQVNKTHVSTLVLYQQLERPAQDAHCFCVLRVLHVPVVHVFPREYASCRCQPGSAQERGSGIGSVTASGRLQKYLYCMCSCSDLLGIVVWFVLA